MLIRIFGCRSYKTVKLLNHGSFGMVSLAKDLQTGEMVAIKCLTKINSEATTEFAIDEHFKKYEFHSRVRNQPNIATLSTSFTRLRRNATFFWCSTIIPMGIYTRLFVWGAVLWKLNM